jgi:hypothetical protein
LRDAPRCELRRLSRGAARAGAVLPLSDCHSPPCRSPAGGSMSRQHRMAGFDDPPCVDLEVCSGARAGRDRGRGDPRHPPCDMITASGWRRPRLTIASRGSGALPGELLSGTSRQPRDLTAPVPVRACPALRSPRLRRDPRSHGLPGHPRTFAVRAWQESCWSGCQGPCEQPLAPTATHNLSSFFELGHLPEPRYGIKP